MSASQSYSAHIHSVLLNSDETTLLPLLLADNNGYMYGLSPRVLEEMPRHPLSLLLYRYAEILVSIDLQK
jgi:hypothetical protein